MNIIINAVKFKADQKLNEFVEDKIQRLVKHSPQVIGAEITMKLEQDHEHGNKVVDIRLEIKGNDLFARKQASTFEEACVEACEALKNQLEKIKF
ncbi:MAG: HPF/RaiA family ribosome-associated protein [Bacteroidales bacterium]|jgi:ribosomal subunit interface protein|nr:HPF/RaiA family ribosome-associated protein [Bacteroidales bacterium]